MIDIRKLPNQTITQKEFVSEFYKQFLYDNSLIANIEPLLYEGVILGSEFEDYDPLKLYVCFSFVTSYSGVAGAGIGRINFFNELNALFIYLQDNNVAYEIAAAAIWYGLNNGKMKNFWFSRLSSLGYLFIKFIGYRITLV